MKDIHFKYVFDKEYNAKYVNGAFGGVGPQGEIIIHFFCERGAIPYEVQQTVDDNGLLSDPTSVEPTDFDQTFVRIVQSGIIMDRAHALSVYKWLGGILGETNEK